MYCADFSNKKYKNDNHVAGTIHINVEDATQGDLRKTCYEEIMSHVLGVVLIQQFSLKAGLNKFGPKGVSTTTKECKQLHDMTTFYPMDAFKLTKEHKAEALESLMFLIEKRNGLL